MWSTTQHLFVGPIQRCLFSLYWLVCLSHWVTEGLEGVLDETDARMRGEVVHIFHLLTFFYFICCPVFSSFALVSFYFAFSCVCRTTHAVSHKVDLMSLSLPFCLKENATFYSPSASSSPPSKAVNLKQIPHQQRDTWHLSQSRSSGEPSNIDSVPTTQTRCVATQPAEHPQRSRQSYWNVLSR